MKGQCNTKEGQSLNACEPKQLDHLQGMVLSRRNSISGWTLMGQANSHHKTLSSTPLRAMWVSITDFLGF